MVKITDILTSMVLMILEVSCMQKKYKVDVVEPTVDSEDSESEEDTEE